MPLRPSPPPEGAPQVLAEVASAPLDSLASEINRRSLNLGAELLLQWAGGRDRAHERLTQHVREVIGSSEGVYLADGSGLSYEDRVAPSAFIAYLAKFPGTAAGQNFPQLLPANGTGTLHRLNTGFPGEGVVRAKTGTLQQVSTVVGYLGTSEGVLLVSLMYNGNRPWAARQAQWKLFRELGADGVVIPTDSVPAPPVQMGSDSDTTGTAETAAADAVDGLIRAVGTESDEAGRGRMPAAVVLRPARARDHEYHATDERETGQDRRDRHGVLVVRGGLDRPHVQHLLLVREGESAQGEPHHADHDQDESDDRAGLHTGRRPWMTRIRMNRQRDDQQNVDEPTQRVR